MAKRRSKQDVGAKQDAPQNWQDVGGELWARFIYHYDQIRALEAARREAQRQLSAAHQDMVVAVGPERDLPSFVLYLLKSRRKLTQFDRRILADLLKKILTPKPIKKRGPPQQRKTRKAASLAIGFYQMWKDANRENGINDWGRRKEMKDEACRLVIELVRPQQNAPTFEQVRDLMERPAARRTVRKE